MRGGVVAVGVVLLLIGAVLLFYPLDSSSAAQSGYDLDSSSSSATFNIFSASPAYLVETTGTLSWTANVSVTLFVVSCTNAVTVASLEASSNATSASGCSSPHYFGASTYFGFPASTGTSGSLSVSVPSSGSLVMFAVGDSESTVSESLKVTEPLAGLVLVGIGVLLLLVGAATGGSKEPKPKPASSSGSPPGPAQPWTPPPSNVPPGPPSPPAG